MKDENYYYNEVHKIEDEFKDLKNQLNLKVNELSEVQDFAYICSTTIRTIEDIQEYNDIKYEIKNAIKNKKSIDVYSNVVHDATITLKTKYYIETSEIRELHHSFDGIQIMVDDEYVTHGPALKNNIVQNPKYIQEIDDLYDEWLQLFDKKIEDICKELNLVITEKNISSLTSFKYTIANSEV